jgi:hypothetical protein
MGCDPSTQRKLPIKQGNYAKCTFAGSPHQPLSRTDRPFQTCEKVAISVKSLPHRPANRTQTLSVDTPLLWRAVTLAAAYPADATTEKRPRG